MYARKVDSLSMMVSTLVAYWIKGSNSILHTHKGDKTIYFLPANETTEREQH